MAKRMTVEAARTVLAARGLDTREAALAARVEIDVARWGEGERAASREQHARRSHALLVNAIAVANVDRIDEELKAAATAIMTAEDARSLRDAG